MADYVTVRVPTESGTASFAPTAISGAPKGKRGHFYCLARGVINATGPTRAPRRLIAHTRRIAGTSIAPEGREEDSGSRASMPDVLGSSVHGAFCTRMLSVPTTVVGSNQNYFARAALISTCRASGAAVVCVAGQ